MLLVIIWRGRASYDSVLHLPPLGGLPYPTERGPHEESRPPLANQLFNDRGLFVQVMNSYVACKPTVNRLRGNVQVEQQLAKFEQEAETYPRCRSQYRKVARRPPVVFDDGIVGFPALAIPIERKDVFSCPPPHLQALAEALPKVTKMITIGWRATEQHFLTMLGNR